MTLEDRAREVLWITLDGLQMTERQRDNAVAAMLAFGAGERQRVAKVVDAYELSSPNPVVAAGENIAAIAIAERIRNMEQS